MSQNKKGSNDSATDLTADILKAMQELQDAVQSAESRAAVVVQPTSSVPPVNGVLAYTANPTTRLLAGSTVTRCDPSATRDQIQQAMDDLQNATATAKTEREAANQSAHDAIAAANQSAVSGDPAVQEALAKLQAIMLAVAAQDSASDLTADIASAMTALQNAMQDANNALDALRQDASDLISQAKPVSHEADVAPKVAALQKLLGDDPNAITTAIENATAALQAALQKDGASRQSTNTAADKLVAEAKNPAIANNEAVAQAMQHLQAVQAEQAAADNPNSLTADINAATKALADAIKAAEANRNAARDAASSLLGKTAPLSNEAAVGTAKVALQKLLLLANPTSTAAQIADATQAVRNAVSQAQPDRDAANTAADDAIAQVPSDLADEPSVSAAVANLKKIQVMSTAATDTADALSQDILDAIQTLADARDVAAAKQDTARQDAADALAQTAPLSNEKPVADAVRELKNAVLANPDATASEIAAATAALNTAATADKSDRDDANAAGTQAIADAQGSDQVNEPAVKSALQELQLVVMSDAANDSPDALTADIDAARKALDNALATAQAAQEQARKDAASAVAQASPVSHELATAQAINALIEKVLANDTATAQEITDATQKLLNETADAKADRSSAETDAQNTITKAMNSEQSEEPAVQEAIDHLNQEMQAEAATDSSAALTADIAEKLAELKTAVNQAATAQEAAKDKANEALNDLQPVSNEPGVETAKAALLDKLLADPAASTQDVQNATKALTEATTAEKDKRDAINTEADSYITDVQNSAQASEPTVVSALNALRQDLQAKAATDDADALTADIEQAIADLATAQETAAGNQETARDAAKAAIAETEPVSYEDTVSTARKEICKLFWQMRMQRPLKFRRQRKQ
ncbi:hypothetical protein H7R52_12075 [Weissella confusa]|uniref:Uncharacterized protein n=1 Tax=Weissella confusa TaxID=1583 RepID=A0A923NGM7_WEICO|nr:hypothetical protein [Weissella confusa]